MLRNLNQTTSGRRVFGVNTVGIGADIISAETSTGDNGPGLLYDDAIRPENSGKQLRCHIDNYSGTPSALFVFENGSLTISNEVDGSYIINYSVYVDGVLSLSDTATVNIGIINAVVTGATGTGTGSGSGGDAVGTVTADGSVTGATGTGTGSGSGGDAVGTVMADGSVTGATGTGTGSGSGGDAIGTVTADGSVTGATGTSTGSGSGGVPQRTVTVFVKMNGTYIVGTPIVN